MAGLGWRMTEACVCGGGPFRAGREPRHFFLFEKRYPTFVPRKNEISIKTGDTGNFVSA